MTTLTKKTVEDRIRAWSLYHFQGKSRGVIVTMCNSKNYKKSGFHQSHSAGWVSRWIHEKIDVDNVCISTNI